MMRTNKIRHLLLLFGLGALGTVYMLILTVVYVAIAGPVNLIKAPLLSALALAIPVAVVIVPVSFFAAHLASTNLRRRVITASIEAIDAEPNSPKYMQLEKAGKKVFSFFVLLISSAVMGALLIYAVLAGFISRLLAVHWLAALGAVVALILLVLYLVFKRKYHSVKNLLMRYFIGRHQGPHTGFMGSR